MNYNQEIYNIDYYHSDTEWEGFKPILFSLQYILDLPKNFSLLDVGCARGSLVKSAREIGIEAYGYDFSEWCIKNAIPEVSQFIYLQDILNPTYSNTYDLVISLNTIEHFYSEDFEKAINNIIKFSKGWVFLLIDNTSKDSRGVFKDMRFAPSKDEDFNSRQLDDFEAKCIKDGHYYFVPQIELDKRISYFKQIDIESELVDKWRKNVPNLFLNDWSAAYILKIHNDQLEINKNIYNSNLTDDHNDFKNKIIGYCKDNNIKFIDKNILSIPNDKSNTFYFNILEYVLSYIINIKEDIFLFEILQDLESIEDLNKIFNVSESQKIFISMKHNKYPHVTKTYKSISWWDDYVTDNDDIYSDADEAQKVRDYIDINLQGYLHCFFCIKRKEPVVNLDWRQHGVVNS